MQPSNPLSPPIQIELCKERAEECRRLVEKSQQTSVTTMLEHIARTVGANLPRAYPDELTLITAPGNG